MKRFEKVEEWNALLNASNKAKESREIARRIEAAIKSVRDLVEKNRNELRMNTWKGL